MWKQRNKDCEKNTTKGAWKRQLFFQIKTQYASVCISLIETETPGNKKKTDLRYAQLVTSTEILQVTCTEILQVT